MSIFPMLNNLPFCYAKDGAQIEVISENVTTKVKFLKAYSLNVRI